ncbi:hypothetical protein CBM2599_A120532 [Cupriavidus taiwanensis]|uniref:hypothetical protein n=1 Tax=Cupriavidus taiwanensis TaxID=164546 RepID=UPI000E117A9F|nr:hypothetical protein [Cupriavidus taiwanensis]SOY79967.1 hypothetical protein CBM2599_A120532 [Cupriavidus taiwanensis]SOY81936.1 hypothetical protein CBM2600_A120554 [Cupriavidus taiwanensis]
MKLEITFEDRALVVTGEHHRAYAATWTDPGESESFEVYTITEAGVDITDIVSNAAFCEIEALALEACGDEAEYARDSYYEGLREERMLEQRA